MPESLVRILILLFVFAAVLLLVERLVAFFAQQRGEGQAINKRLEWYLGADHLIGHGYFTHVESFEQLDEVIANKIIPLLREYFHEDLGRVRAILGGGDAFLRRERISAPPGIDDAYEDERFRYVDNYLELGQYGREAYDELIGSVPQQTG